MAAITSVTFSALAQSPDRKFSSRSSSVFTSQSPKLLGTVSYDLFTYRASAPRFLVHCMSTAADVPTVSQTKSNFLRTYKKPIPSIYNTVLQELIVQQHLIRYKTSYRYDPVFALGFVTVYDQLMEGYPEYEERDAIFKSYIEALNEDPAQYRIDAKKLEEWSQTQSTSTLVEFQSRGGEVEDILKEISQRAGSKGSFSYSRFFAVGLFRILELANATESSILDMLCAALNINKKSVDRDLDVYRNLLSKLVQAKELLKEYIDRERKKNEERTASQKPNEAVTKILGNNQLTASSLHTCR